MGIRFPREFAPNPFYNSQPFAHQVPIATVRDNLYVLTDYSLSAVFRVHGMEYDLAGTQEKVQFVNGLKSVLNMLVPGVNFKLLHRITHNYKDWLDEHVATTDGEQVFARYVAWDQARFFSEMMENRMLLRSDNLVILTYNPETEWWKSGNPVDVLKNAFLDIADAATVKQRPFRQYQAMIQKFEDMIRPVEQQMNIAGLRPKRLGNQDLYQLAWETLNPRTSLRHSCPTIQKPNSKMDPNVGIFATGAGKAAAKKNRRLTVVAPLSEREQLVASDWRIHEDCVEHDGAFYGAVSMRMLPTHVYPSMALQLSALPFECTISLDACMLQKQKELDKQWSEARNAEGLVDATFMNATPDPADRELAEAKRQRYLQLTSSHENPFRFRLVITFAAESKHELKQRADSIITLLRGMEAAQAIRETYGVDTLIKTTWPFSQITDINSRKAMTSHIAYLMPVFSRWEGSKRAVTLVLDPLNRLVRHDPFPKNQLNKNRTICGASGSGKSFACQLADVQPHAARKGSEILIVESGGSFELTTKCFGGTNIRLGPRSPYHINPFDLPPSFDEMTPEEQEIELRYKYGFIKNLVLCMARLTNPEEAMLAENVIGTVCQRTYATVRQPRFRDFYRILGQYSNPDDQDAERLAKRVMTLLANYVINEKGEKGIFADYFDCDTDFNADAPIICFDLIDIKNDPALLGPMTMVVILGLIYNRIMKRDGKERLVIVDEAWALIKDGPNGEQSPAGQGIELFWREGRKLGASSTMISQNYSDMAGDKVGRAVVGNSPIQYFLKHERLSSNDQAFRSANFSTEKIERVYGLTTKYGEYSEIMIKEGSDWGVVRLPSPGLRYWLATTDPEDLNLRRRYEETYGKGYGLEQHVIVALLAQDYPAGAHAAHGKEMSEQEALAFAERFKDHLARFEALIREGKPVPFNFV